jgi:DNA-binding beta-propeller fold protein YncE
MNMLSRIDLATGDVTSATATAAIPAGDGLAGLGRQIGRWLAPPTAAKSLVEPAIVVSPDGTRIYAIGVDARSGADAAGSRGIYVFDATSLAQVGHWPPKADLISLAISRDGRFVYAAGDSGRTAAGDTSQDEASITVYDAADGTVRLIAGRLGNDSLFFPGATVR